MKKKSLLLLLVILCSLNCKPAVKRTTQTTSIVEFIVHGKIPQEKLNEIKRTIEKTQQRLATDFNLNDDEVYRIHIWDNYKEFLDEQERRMGARFNGVQGYIFSMNDIALFYNENAIENVEHEFAHIASLYLNNSFGNNPRWLWEAVAAYESGEFNDPKNFDYLRNGKFPTISELNSMIDTQNAHKIYQLGYVLSEFIIKKWDRKTYLKLIKASGDIPKVLNISEKEFEKKWKVYITETYLLLSKK